MQIWHKLNAFRIQWFSSSIHLYWITTFRDAICHFASLSTFFFAHFLDHFDQATPEIINFPLFFFCRTANTGLYAHYVFKTLDSDHSGIVSFEVSWRPYLSYDNDDNDTNAFFYKCGVKSTLSNDISCKLITYVRVHWLVLLLAIINIFNVFASSLLIRITSIYCNLIEFFFPSFFSPSLFPFFLVRFVCVICSHVFCTYFTYRNSFKVFQHCHVVQWKKNSVGHFLFTILMAMDT